MNNPRTTTMGSAKASVASKLSTIDGARNINQIMARIMKNVKHPQELIGLRLYLLGYPIPPWWVLRRRMGRLIRLRCLFMGFGVDFPLDRRILLDLGLAFEPSPPARLGVFFFLGRLPRILGTIHH